MCQAWGHSSVLKPRLYSEDWISRWGPIYLNDSCLHGPKKVIQAPLAFGVRT